MRPRSPRRRGKRDYRAEYESRNAAARRLGYRSYYDFRMHGHGRTPPGAPVPTSPESRSRARGHRSTADFLRQLGPGDLISLVYGIASIEIYLDGKGVERYRAIDKSVIDAETGHERWYTLRRLSRPQLVALIEEEERRGAVFSPAPSLDQRRLASADAVEGGY